MSMLRQDALGESALGPRLRVRFSRAEGVIAREPTPVAPAGPVWDLLQGVLDEAFEAVHQARLRGEETASLLEAQREEIAGLTTRCAELEGVHEDGLRAAAAWRAESERLNAELTSRHESAAALPVEKVQRQARLFHSSLNEIAVALSASERQMGEIRAHYCGLGPNPSEMIEELNFARAEALAKIGRVIQSLVDRATKVD